jgi:small GTP-binding protein
MTNAKRRFKVVLLGDAGVGKTSIMNRKAHGAFDYEVASTIGHARAQISVDVDRQVVDLCLWDTAGQERFKSLTANLLRDTVVAVIVGSVTDYTSIQAMAKDWKELVVRECGENTAMVAAINKIDLKPVEDTTVGDLCLSDTFGTVLKVSAQTGEGIEELFLTVAKAAMCTELGRVVEEEPRPGDEADGPGCC